MVRLYRFMPNLRMRTMDASLSASDTYPTEEEELTESRRQG
jgi:hypothetical protein